MQNSDGVANHVTCLLAHDLVNKLSAIVGHCDILDTKILDTRNEADSECHEGLRHIRQLATLMATMLHQRQCEVDAGDGALTLHDGFAIEAHHQHTDKNLAQQMPSEALEEAVVQL
jgi:hypothetical protein